MERGFEDKGMRIRLCSASRPPPGAGPPRLTARAPILPGRARVRRCCQTRAVRSRGERTALLAHLRRPCLLSRRAGTRAQQRGHARAYESNQTRSHSVSEDDMASPGRTRDQRSCAARMGLCACVRGARALPTERPQPAWGIGPCWPNQPQSAWGIEPCRLNGPSPLGGSDFAGFNGPESASGIELTRAARTRNLPRDVPLCKSNSRALPPRTRHMCGLVVSFRYK